MSTTRKAQVIGGEVANVGEFRDPAPAWASDWIDVDDTIGVGWSYDGSNFTAPPDPAGTPEQVVAEMTRRLETGKTFNVTAYASPILVEGTQQNITDLIIRERQVGLGALTVTWTSGGITHTLTGSQFLELFGQALSHGEALRNDMRALLAMDPISADFADDSYWTQ